MTYFAKIDENDMVVRVISAEQDFIDAEHPGLGPKESWIQTSYNNNIRRCYAGLGYKYYRDASLKDGGIFLRPEEIEYAEKIVEQWKSQGEKNEK